MPYAEMFLHKLIGQILMKQNLMILVTSQKRERRLEVFSFIFWWNNWSFLNQLIIKLPKYEFFDYKI